MEVLDKIRILLEPMLQNGYFYLVDLSQSGNKQKKVTVLLDTDAGISIDECALISRQLGEAIEAEGLFENPYHLEVSSPGIDSPLSSLRAYQKNLGRHLAIVKTDGDKLQGKLISASPEGIEIQEEVLRGRLKTFKKENTTLPMALIKTAQVQVSFS